MKRLFTLLLTIIFVLPLYAQEFDGQSCTALMVGKKASADGSVITSHTCDGRYRTWVQMEPAADHEPGSMHPVLRGTMQTRFRGDTTGVKLMGEIPQVAHTYAYLNTAYPCLNEKQLAMGETTFGGPDTLVNAAGWFTIEELERVALQRCDNARDAIRLMGALAEQYGYGDGGECLTVADKNEVWQFEIVGVGKNKIGAAWVAKRVPDDHVAISANIPRIGKINRKDKDMMASANVEQVAIDNGLWDGKGAFVFWKAFNTDYAKGKNFNDREYFILNHLAPSLGLSYDMDELPFSVKPDKPVDIRQVMALYRETYEGTDFDMTRNIKLARPATKKHPADTVVSPVANPWLTTTLRNTLNTIAPGTVASRSAVRSSMCRTVICGSSAAPTSWPPSPGKPPKKASTRRFSAWKTWPSRAFPPPAPPPSSTPTRSTFTTRVSAPGRPWRTNTGSSSGWASDKATLWAHPRHDCRKPSSIS